MSKLKVKDVKAFVKTAKVTYADVAGIKFYATLHAGPNVRRYIVEFNGDQKEFISVREAVSYFNEIQKEI